MSAITVDLTSAVLTPKGTWRFPRDFWTANVIELFERAAYYGTFIALALFLTSIVGFTDVEAGFVAGLFSSFLYLLPFFTGAAADRIGYRRALLIAFSCLTVGYAGLGLFPRKGPVLLSLLFVMVGGAFVKPVITGTVARTSDEVNRARAYSLFYMLVNVGAFLGKTVAKPVRTHLGLSYVPLYSAGAALLALLAVGLFYWPAAVTQADARPGGARSAREFFGGLLTVLRNGRFLLLVLITAGFWAIQGQLYASMPKYVLRMVGDKASPEWYANVDPLVIVLLVVPVTQLARRYRPVTSITIALGLIPLSALCIGLLPGLLPAAWLGNIHPITVAMLLGIAIQGAAQCFLGPRYYEYASRLAPRGQEGLYLGYSYLNVFVAWLFGFILSGYLLEAFCPDPKTLSPADQAARLLALQGHGSLPPAYAHAHYLWYTFFAIGAVVFVLLLVFQSRGPGETAPHR